MEWTGRLASVHRGTLASLQTVRYRVQPLGDLPPVSVPLNPFTLVHAVRLAFMYHDALYRGAKGTTVGLYPGVARVGYVQALLVVWTLVFAGPALAAVLRGQPAPLLVDPEAGLIAAIYAGACILMTPLYPLFTANKPVRRTLDAFFLVVDGFATALGTITLGLAPLLAPAGAELPSLVPLFVLPTITGSLGSHLVPFFSLFSPTFAFSHPSYLSSSLLASPDVWGPWLLVAVYGGLADGRGPLFGAVRQLLLFQSSSPFDKKAFSADEAHAACSILMSLIFLANDFAPALLAAPMAANPQIKPKPKRAAAQTLPTSTTSDATAVSSGVAPAAARAVKRKKAKPAQT